MLCKEIIEIIEKRCPKEWALEWDNVGLLCGRQDRGVKKIYVALDATDEVIDEALRSKADMLVTHHPLIFHGVKQINDTDLTGRRLLKLMESGVCCYAMHTNYDVLGMAELSAGIMGLQDSEVLEVTAGEEGIGRVGSLKEPVTLEELCRDVKEKFRLESVKVFGRLERRISRAAISPGAGKSMVEPAIRKGADVLVTGDIDHHTGIDAAAMGLNIIDAGHYGLEHIFIEDMGRYLEETIPEVEIVRAGIQHPFQIV